MASGIVVTYPIRRGAHQHERATHAAIARSIAELKGFDFGGEYDPAAHRGRPLYFVPDDTLDASAAQAVGIRSSEDLFGGVVPFDFAATKAIVHPLIGQDAHAPHGWSRGFTERVKDVVLPGYATFSLEDARRAALALLEEGPVRLKQGQGIGGHGQAIVAAAGELDEALQKLDSGSLGRCGLTVELDLADATTYSIGQVRIAGLEATYCGTQRMTSDNAGEAAYGGSDLVIARGGFDALAALPLEPAAREAIAQARVFDAATEEFTGLFASRRNYDGVRGRDARGRWRSGILEQSWRIGGASGPEVAALAAFRAAPALQAVHASSTELYGDAEAPTDAIVHFAGTDSRVGPILKYTRVEAYEASR